MNWFGQILSGAGVHFLDLDDVGVGLELDVVEDAHRRHHKAHLDRERASQRLDLFGQAVCAVRAVDQRQQRVAEFDLEVVDLERGGDRLLRRGAGGSGCEFGRRGFGRFRRPGDAVVVARLPGQRSGAAAERQEGQHRNARQQRQHQHHAGRHAERLRVTRRAAASSPCRPNRMMPAFETSRPAAVETISAGTCVTRPSPTVSTV